MDSSLRDKKVLYVEDDAEVLSNISQMLSNFFDTIYTASDGLEALEIYREHDIDILIVDIEMPRLSGIDLIKQIRRDDSETLAIIISAYTKTDYLLESVELGLVKYIVKPLTSKKINELLHKIEEHFQVDSVVWLSDELYVDTSRSMVISQNIEQPLTSRELKFLLTLSNHHVITYEQIFDIWDGDEPTDNAIRSCVKYLRKKLPDGFIKNRSGVGYYIETDR